jgi:hypothetical protein
VGGLAAGAAVRERTGTMLHIPPAATKAVRAAFAYLRRDRVERALIDRLEHAPQRFRLSVNYRNVDAFDPNTRTIRWDPYSALRTTRGGRQSPALGLGHEIDHAVHDGARCERLARIPDPRYDNREERRVVCGSELHAARTLGEAIRHDHAGSCYRVDSPISRATRSTTR